MERIRERMKVRERERDMEKRIEVDSASLKGKAKIM